MPDEIRIVAMASGALVALLRIVAMASGALVALLNTTNNRCYSTLREFFPPSHTCIYE